MIFAAPVFAFIRRYKNEENQRSVEAKVNRPETLHLKKLSFRLSKGRLIA